jgi:hypothetical protein
MVNTPFWDSSIIEEIRLDPIEALIRWSGANLDGRRGKDRLEEDAHIRMFTNGLKLTLRIQDTVRTDEVRMTAYDFRPRLRFWGDTLSGITAQFLCQHAGHWTDTFPSFGRFILEL